ncbi:hypothetical protein M9458_026873, partial [Cirrhinus mrigala]
MSPESPQDMHKSFIQEMRQPMLRQGYIPIPAAAVSEFLLHPSSSAAKFEIRWTYTFPDPNSTLPHQKHVCLAHLLHTGL